MAQSLGMLQNEPIMNGTRRRPYKKSTRGCTNCKSRKVKCDEVKPCCGKCKKHYLDASSCWYDLIPKRRGDPQNQSSSSSDLPELPLAVSARPSGSRDQDRLLELRLLHHYTKSTFQATSLRDMVPILHHPMWATDIPQMAFSSDVVLDALLAISAIHLHFLTPDDHAIERASKSYLKKAVKKQRLAIEIWNSESAEPLLIAGVLIAHHTHLSAHSYDPEKDTYEIDLKTFQMCRGLHAMFDRVQPLLLKYEWCLFQNKISQTSGSSENAFIKSALEDLALISGSFAKDEIPLEERETYHKTTKDIAASYGLLATRETYLIEQRIVTFFHRLPANFISLLERQDPIAMALLARNQALLYYLDTSSAWWIHGAGDHKVGIKSVRGIYGLMPPNWLWAMEWPLKVVTGQIQLIRK